MNPQISERRYLAPDRVSRSILNPLLAGLVKLGFSVRGAHLFEVRGRTSGRIRTVPVNPLELGGHRYLVAPRGHTEWVRNLRAAGEGRLRKGRHFDEFTAVEVADVDKPPILRAYLERWSAETARFFEGLTTDSTDAEITTVAADFPVFEIAIVSG